MLTIILKELRCYCNSVKYRRIQFLILCVLAVLLFVATVEFYAYRLTGNAVDVGKQTYMLFIIALFGIQFWVPRHAVETWHIETRLQESGGNGFLLALTPLANWKILVGKLCAVVIWMVWSIWLAIPLLALSSYIGGLAVLQLVKCGAVLLVSCILFSLIGTGFGVRNAPLRAKSISYGIVLFITFFPLVPFPPFDAIPMLAAISPLCALLSILSAHPTNLWVWNIGLFCVLSVLIFPVIVKQIHF